jgi:hypothetical protein
MAKRTLSMDVRVGESVQLDGGRITVTVEAKSGQRARLAFQLDPGITAQRAQAPTPAALARGGLRWPR